MPDLTTVHIDAPLTNMTVARIQAASAFIAPNVFPIISTLKRSNKYFVFDKGDFNRLEMRRGAPGRKAPSVGYRLSNDSFFCEKYHVRNPTPEEIQREADAPIDLRGRNATQWITLQMLMQMEVLFAAAYWAPATWTTDWDGVSSNPSTGEILQWDQSSSTPIADVSKLKDAVEDAMLMQDGKWVAVAGKRTHRILFNHDDLVGRLNYTNDTTSAVVRGQMAGLLDVDEYLVGRGRYNTAARGQTDSYSAIMTDNDFGLFYVPNSPGLETEAAGYIMGWTGMPGASAKGTRIRRYVNEEEETSYVEGAMWIDMKQTSADCGGFIDAAVGATA